MALGRVDRADQKTARVVRKFQQLVDLHQVVEEHKIKYVITCLNQAAWKGTTKYSVVLRRRVRPTQGARQHTQGAHFGSYVRGSLSPSHQRCTSIMTAVPVGCSRRLTSRGNGQ